MEDNIQTIIGIIISIFLLFVFPVYMAYEKKDDISYALAMRYTQDFVNDVRKKGYLTADMLEEYKDKLAVTGNSYDLELTHTKQRIDPITQYYKKDGNKLVLQKTGTQEDRLKEESDILQNAYDDGILSYWDDDFTKQEFIQYVYEYQQDIDKVVDTYKVSEEIYSTEHIEAVLATENKMWFNATSDNFKCVDDKSEEDFSTLTKKVYGCEYAYIMSKSDKFNVTIKNTNTTLATVLYNMVTINALDNNTRIYVNYGGEIINEKWYGKIDYSKMKHDDVNIYNLEEKMLFEDNKEFKKDGTGANIVKMPSDIMDLEEYIVEFEVKPFEITDLREKGYWIKTHEYSLYNLAVGIFPSRDGLEVSIGINGIALIVNYVDSYESQVILTYPTPISTFTKVRIKVQPSEKNVSKYVAILYINDVRVGESIPLSNPPSIYRIGQGYLSNRPQNFSGYIRNARVYY